MTKLNEMSAGQKAEFDAAVGAAAQVASKLPSLQPTDIPYPLLQRTRPITKALVNVQGGWGAAGTANLALDATKIAPSGAQAVKVNGNGNQFPSLYARTALYDTPSGLNTSFDGSITIRFFLDTNFSGNLGLTFRYSSDTPSADPPNATPTNYRRVSIPSAILQKGTWNEFKIHPASASVLPGQNGAALEWLSDVGSPVVNKFKHCQIAVTFPDTNPANQVFWFDPLVTVGGKGLPILMLTFDGTYTAGGTRLQSGTIEGALALYNSYGIVGANFCDAEKFPAVKTVLDQLYDAGWDIGQQPAQHANLVTEYNNGNTTRATTDFALGDSYMTDYGYLRSRHIYAPSQAATNRVIRDQLYGLGVRFIRGGGLPRIVRSQYGNPWSINPGQLPQTYHWQSDIPNGTHPVPAKNISWLDEMKGWIDDMLLHGSDLCKLGHGLTTGTPNADGLQSSYADEAGFIAYAAQKRDEGRLLILPPSQALKLIGVTSPLIA